MYEGPSCYIDQNEAALLGLVPGFYALNEDGKGLLRRGIRKRPMRLVMVDDAPGDPNDGSCHLEVARKGDPIVRAGNPVSLQFSGHGKAKVNE